MTIQGVHPAVLASLAAAAGLTAGYYLLRHTVWKRFTARCIGDACRLGVPDDHLLHGEHMLMVNERRSHPACMPFCCLAVTFVGSLLALAGPWGLRLPAELYVYEAVAALAFAAFSCVEFLEYAVVLGDGVRLRSWRSRFRCVTIPFAEIIAVRLCMKGAAPCVTIATRNGSHTLGAGLDALAVHNLLTARLNRAAA